MYGSDKFNAFSGKLRFAGGRFTEAKPDLQAYAALVSEIALLQSALNADLEDALKKAGHNNAHSIVEKYGFDADVRNLQPGSTVATWSIGGVANAGGQHFSDDMPVPARIKETIKTWADTFFAGLKDGFSDSSLIPPRVLNPLFDAGAYLKEGEEVEISRDGDSNPVRINYGYGRRMQKRIEATQMQPQLPTELYGRVSGINGKLKRFAFKPIDMPFQTIAFENKHRDIIHASLGRYGHPINRPLYLRLRPIEAGQRATKACQLLLDTAEEVNRLPPRLQILSIKQLKKGWYFGEGTAFDNHALDKISRGFEQYWGDHPLPALAPNADGALVLEWRFGDWSVSADISLDDDAQFSTYWHALNLETYDMREEDNILLNESVGWQRLTQLVASLQAG